MATRATRKTSTWLVRLSGPRNCVSTAASAGGAMIAAASAASCLRGPDRPHGAAGQRPLPARSWVTMCTSISPDQCDRGLADAAEHQPRHPVAPAAAEHQLGRAGRAGEVEQRPRNVVADHLVVGAAEGFHQPALCGQLGRRRVGKPVAACHVHGEQVTADRAGGDPGGAPDQRRAFGAAGERDDHPLACLPGLLDLVVGPVLLSPSSTLPATHSRASSRSAVRLPTRK